MDSNNPYAAPKAVVDAEAPAASGELASPWSRLGATMIDGLIIGVIYFPIALYIIYPLTLGESGFTAILNMAHHSLPVRLGTEFLSAVLALAIFFLLNLRLLRAQGQTIGKRAVGLRILSSNHQPATLVQMVKRFGFMYFIRMFLTLGGLIAFVDDLCIFRSSRQCLHDSIADTIVVKV
jgi:uncharacterized RDD family membrane protein YckC